MKLPGFSIPFNKVVIVLALLYLFYEPVSYAGHALVFAALGARTALGLVFSATESLGKKISAYDKRVLGAEGDVKEFEEDVASVFTQSWNVVAQVGRSVGCLGYGFSVEYLWDDCTTKTEAAELRAYAKKRYEADQVTINTVHDAREELSLHRDNPDISAKLDGYSQLSSFYLSQSTSV